MVDKRFRTFSAPDQRVILGSSLAAYGAVDLAVEYPSLFGLCAAIAPPAQTASLIANQPKARKRRWCRSSSSSWAASTIR